MTEPRDAWWRRCATAVTDFFARAEHIAFPAPGARVTTHARPPLLFVTEQVGPLEDEVKARLVPVLAAHGDVERAYLVRAESLADHTQSVYLCLRMRTRLEPELVEHVSHALLGLLGGGAHLDILQIGEAEEPALWGVCSPFFGQPAGELR